MSYSPNYRGTQSDASSRQLITGYTNASLSTAIPQGTPVAANTSGQVAPVNVSDQVSVQAMVGYAYTRISANSVGAVISQGRLENFISSWGTFNVGDAIYVGPGGILINTKPSVGSYGFSSGDFVVFVGVLVQNQLNPSLSDLQLFTQTVGQL